MSAKVTRVDIQDVNRSAVTVLHADYPDNPREILLRAEQRQDAGDEDVLVLVALSLTADDAREIGRALIDYAKLAAAAERGRA